MANPYETNPGGEVYGAGSNPNGYIDSSAQARIDSAREKAKPITEQRAFEDRVSSGFFTRTVGNLFSKMLGHDGVEEAAEQFRSDRDGLGTLPGTIADKVQNRKA